MQSTLAVFCAPKSLESKNGLQINDPRSQTIPCVVTICHSRPNDFGKCSATHPLFIPLWQGTVPISSRFCSRCSNTGCSRWPGTCQFLWRTLHGLCHVGVSRNGGWMVYTWTSYENGWFRGTHLWKPPCGHGKGRTLPRHLQPCSFCGIFQVSAWALVSGRHQSCARLLPSGMQGTPDVRGGSSPSQTSLEPTDLTTIKRLTHLTNAMNDVDETQFVGSKPSANFSNICRDSRDYAMEVWSRNPVQKTQFSKEISIVCLRDEQNFHNFEPIIASTSHTTFSIFFILFPLGIFIPGFHKRSVAQSDRPRWLHKQCAWLEQLLQHGMRVTARSAEEKDGPRLP